MSDYESYEPDDIRLKLEDNPVHTFLYLTGTASALAQADAVVEHVEKYGVGPKNGYYSRQPDEIRKGQDGDARWYDIVIDNHVPQIYEQLEAIEGLDPVIFYSTSISTPTTPKASSVSVAPISVFPPTLTSNL